MQNWTFVIICSRRPHNCKTGNFTSQKERERLRNVKNEKCTCKACKTILFHCQRCKFVTFLLPSSPWLRKLPKVGDAESCETPIHPMILVIPIDLFRLFILFSQYKSCDNKEKVLKKKCCKKAKYGISVQILRLQGWNFAGLMCCKNYTFSYWLRCDHSNILVTRPLSS